MRSNYPRGAESAQPDEASKPTLLLSSVLIGLTVFGWIVFFTQYMQRRTLKDDGLPFAAMIFGMLLLLLVPLSLWLIWKSSRWNTRQKIGLILISQVSSGMFFAIWEAFQQRSLGFSSLIEMLVMSTAALTAFVAPVFLAIWFIDWVWRRFANSRQTRRNLAIENALPTFDAPSPGLTTDQLQPDLAEQKVT